ncbi:MAG: hypothetical protein QM770_09935 [Tepidisphaeraceae bacterium]
MPDPLSTLSTPSPGHLAMRAEKAETPTTFNVIDHPRVSGAATIRTLEMRDGTKVIARTTFSNTLDADGHVIILHMEVHGSHRRRGHGLVLFRELQRIASADLLAAGHRLRRVTCEVRQKTHVVARAFLTRLGFHHVTTVRNVYLNQDLLIYLLGCD